MTKSDALHDAVQRYLYLLEVGSSTREMHATLEAMREAVGPAPTDRPPAPVEAAVEYTSVGTDLPAPPEPVEEKKSSTKKAEANS